MSERTATTQKTAPSFNLHSADGLLQRKCDCGNSTTAGGECMECGKKKLQRKLSIGASNDPLEREADRVADQVLAAPVHSAVSGAVPSIQRFTGQATRDEGHAPASVDRVLTGSGRPLDTELQIDMGNRFGYDFSTVRVHTGSAAEQSARDVNAHAYTVGSNIVFGAGKFAPESHAGRKLIAHELTHVVQQEGTSQVTTGHGRHCIQRKPPPPESSWLPELNEILPRGVGPLGHMMRVGQLVNLFGATLLETHTRMIHASPAARKIVAEHGVPGIVALFDTRQEDQLDPGAAKRALTEFPNRYKHESLDRLRLRPPVREAPRSFWFEDPGKQRMEERGEGEFPLTRSELREKVFVESDLSQGRAGSNVVFVRFAYPEVDLGSKKVTIAKKQILVAIAYAMAELTGDPPAANEEERREQLQVRARLAEAWRGFDRKSPLNIYIATEPTLEFKTGMVAAFTDRIYVRLEDVSDPAKLRAAIRVPNIMLEGGILPTAGGVKDIPPVKPHKKDKPGELEGIMLHESLHVLLVRRASDANAIWEASRSNLTMKGNPNAVSKFVELVRKYLIAQEEVFAYENEATLYPPVSPYKAKYDLFLKSVTLFMQRRKVSLTSVSRSIPVEQKVAKKRVTWVISYQVPTGAVDLTVADLDVLDLLLEVYSLG